MTAPKNYLPITGEGCNPEPPSIVMYDDELATLAYGRYCTLLIAGKSNPALEQEPRFQQLVADYFADFSDAFERMQ